jgi:penicillin-binding protein
LDFNKQSGFVKATVSSVSGKLPTDLTRQAGKLVTDYFNEKYLPKESDDALVNMAYITFNGVNYVPQPSTPSDMVSEQLVIKRQKPLDELMSEISAAQAKLPASSRRSMSSYLPADAGKDAPSKVDPRVEDGHAPTPPANVRLQPIPGKSSNQISFSKSPEADVVGYRLYRSLNEEPYKIAGAPVLAGADTEFTNSITPSLSYRYYITAVDVGGHESGPSAIVGSNNSMVPPIQPPLLPGSGDEGAGTPVNQSEGTSQGDAIQIDKGNTGQKPVAPPSAPAGIKGEVTDIGIKLTWDTNTAAENVTSYNVYYSTDQSGKFTKLGSTAEARFEYLSTITSGYFRVTAVNESGESASSYTVQLK